MNKAALYVLFLFVIISGALTTLLLKYQNKQTVLQYQFNHPVFQSTLMFVGEFCCLGIFAIFRNNFEKQEDPKQFNKLLFAIPSIFDVLGTTIKNFGLVVVSASIYQMIRNSGTLFVAILSVIFLKKKLYRHHILGISLIVIGVLLTGTAQLVENPSNRKAAIWGIVCILVGQLFYSMLYAVSYTHLTLPTKRIV